MRKAKQTEKQYDVLLLSYTDYKKEGRCHRAYKALSEIASVYVIDVTNDPVQEPSHTGIRKEANNRKNFINYTKCCYRIAKKIKFKILYVANYYTALAALLIRRFTKCRIIYDAYELYFPEGVDGFSRRDKFFHFFEKKIIHNSNAIIAANESRALIMLGYYRLKKMPYVVENVSGTPGLLSEPHKRNDTYKIVYAGYLAKERGLLELTEAVISLNRDDISLHLYGYGENIDWYLELAKNDSRFAYHGPYNNDMLYEILSKYDIGFIYYSTNSINNIFCAPNKFYDYIYSGLPVIGNDNYGIKRLANDLQLGCCNSDLVCALRDVIENYENYAKNVYELSKIDLQKKVVKTIQKIYNDICK